MTRRRVLRGAMAWAGFAAVRSRGDLLARLAAQCETPPPIGDLIGLARLFGDRLTETTFGRMIGGPGLDARLFTDLAELQPGRLMTPTSQVFVRTAAPTTLRALASSWTIVTARAGVGGAPIRLEELLGDARPMGPHLIECSGNSNPNNFGLMSVAEWDGVPLAEVVTNLRTRLPSTPVSLSESLTPGESRATGVWGVLIAGLDDESNTSRQSIPGASWVFPLDQLLSLGAFLAVRMNGEPLPPDHGAPVRLVVPGWYGCTWIKWVNEIQLVGRDHPATSQMREFARRTHQNGVPALARDYEPPVIDLAATPIRVEKRRVDGHLEYRVVGIVWGGSRPTDRLLIRFHSRDSFKPLTICPPPGTTAMWALWEYRWRPTSAGIYDIVLKAADPTIRTRRLDLFYYLRRVQIDEI